MSDNQKELIRETLMKLFNDYSNRTFYTISIVNVTDEVMEILTIDQLNKNSRYSVRSYYFHFTDFVKDPNTKWQPGSGNYYIDLQYAVKVFIEKFAKEYNILGERNSL